MKNFFLKSGLLFTLLASMFVSCKKDGEQATAEKAITKPEITELNKNFSCKMLHDDPSGAITEANGLTKLKWINGSTIKVRFNSGGSTFVRNKVKEYAKSWETYANITFLFVADNQPADIKIAFANDGSWSALGTDSKKRSTSMNYGWFTDTTSDKEFRRTTVHEFGHALGLNHEQSHPDANIPWNKDAVYKYYMGAPNNWSKAEIDYNVLSTSNKKGLSYSAYDSKSIMHYPVNARFTTNNTTIAADNTTLSKGDIAFIRSYYPGRN